MIWSKLVIILMLTSGQWAESDHSIMREADCYSAMKRIRALNTGKANKGQRDFIDAHCVPVWYQDKNDLRDHMRDYPYKVAPLGAIGDGR